MTSDSDWIKEVSKTYLEEAYGAKAKKKKEVAEETEECSECLEEGKGMGETAVAKAGKEPSYVAKERREREERKESKKVEEQAITNEQLLESFQHLSEEQFDALTDKYLTHLQENYSQEQIDSMTEEQLQEGLMNFARGLVQTGIEKAKALGTKVKQGIKDIEQKGAVAGFEKEKAKLRKSGSSAGHALQQLAAGKAMGSKDESGQQVIRPEDEGVHSALSSAYEKSVQQRTKGIGGLAAKIKGKLTGQSATDVIRAGDEKKLGKLEKAGAIKGEELAGRYRSGTKRAVQQKLASHRAEIERLRKLAGDSE